MGTPLPAAPDPSLVGPTIRRSFIAGRTYLAIEIGISVLFAVTFASAGKNAFGTTYPLILPVFAVTGSLGSLLVFTNDRTKGVFEYLIAYGVRPAQIFGTALLATAALVALGMGVAIGAGLALYTAFNGTAFPSGLFVLLGVYTVPMAFATALFVTIVGMIWSTLSSPRTGMNSPLGLAPMLGVIPTVAVLIAVGALVPAADFDYAAGGVAAAVAVVVVLLVLSAGRLMRRERFLSPM